MTRSFRTQSICRSTNTETEGRCGRATCIGGPTSACCGQLLLALWALFLSPEYGGLYHGSFRRSRADSGFDYYFESVRLRRLYSLSSDRFLQFSYRTIPILFVHKELAFDSLGATRAFLEDHSCAFYVDKNQENLDCKRANAVLNEVYESKYRKVGIKGAIWSISIAPSWCHLYPPCTDCKIGCYIAVVSLNLRVVAMRLWVGRETCVVQVDFYLDTCDSRSSLSWLTLIPTWSNFGYRRYNI